MGEIKYDCFAYRKGDWCVAMRELYCGKEECKFYQTEKAMCERCKATGGVPNCKTCQELRFVLQ